jgi:galactose mutarotase-like enzyme
MSLLGAPPDPQVLHGERDGLETVTLSVPATGLSATFAPGAGMVCCSLIHDGDELLAQNRGLGTYAATGKTMGIPLLHPWANRLGAWSYRALERAVDLRPLAASLPEDEHELPIHGVLPGRWRVVSAAAAAASARLTAELDAGRGSPAHAAFPFPHRMRLDAEVRDATLRVRTTLVPDDGPVPVSFGFHPYFALPGAARERWSIRLPVRRRIVLDGRAIPTGVRERVEPYDGPLGDRHYDDGFDRLADPPAFAVEGGGRRIEVAYEAGFPVAQVFAPPGKAFICFEPMTAPANALLAGGFATATPAAPYAATFAVAVRAAQPSPSSS